LSITNPVIAAAMPENEFSNAMTTGMSAPPMGMTNRTPSTSAMAPISQKGSVSCDIPAQIARATTPATMRLLTIFWPL